MSHSDPLPFAIRAEAPSGGTDHLTRITVYNARNRVVARGAGSVENPLPAGLYQARLTRLGAMEEHLIIHQTGTDESFAPPLRNSAMPSFDARHTHEFFEGPGVHFSRNSTALLAEDDPNAVRLMVMLRADGDHALDGVDLTEGLALFAASGELISHFSAEDCFVDETNGTVIWSAKLPPIEVMLTLRHEGAVQALPIETFRGWDSMVFVPHQGHARLSRASLDMVEKGRGFDPEDRLAQTVDAAMRGLGERLDLLPDDLRQEALYGKFEHPLVGLIGAHAHFLGPDRKARLEGQVLYNLGNLLKDSPDVLALLVMAMEREEGGLPETLDDLAKAAEDRCGMVLRTPMEFPPMLRPGLRALARAASLYPDLVAPDSWLEAAILSPYEAGPWAVWEQEPGSLQLRLKADRNSNFLSNQRVYGALKGAMEAHSSRRARDMRAADRFGDMLDAPRVAPQVTRELSRRLDMPTPDLSAMQRRTLREVARRVQEAAQMQAEQAIRLEPQVSLPQWLVEFTRSELASQKSPDLRRIAMRAGVPLRQVEAAANQLKTFE